MTFEHEHRHMIDILFVLTLFGVFAVSAVLLVLVGAGVYQKTVSSMEDNYSTRTSYAYITEKIRSLDSKNSMSLETIDDIPSIVLSETIDNTTYHTYLYEKDGKLMELFSSANTDLSADAGQPILDCNEFIVKELTNELYQITLSNKSGEKLSFFVGTKSN